MPRDAAVLYAVYLAGDSYPVDRHIEDALRERLADRFVAWVSQEDVTRLCGEDAFCSDTDHRLGQLAHLLPTPGLAERTVLFGRSSGARAVTRFAAARPVHGVVAIGYPFRYPGHEDEPWRYRHLTALDCPTLILQGRTDVYGGETAVGAYPLSAAVDLRLLDTDHEFDLAPAAWDAVAGIVAHHVFRPV